MDFIALLIQIVVGIIFIAPVLWLAGRALAGKDKAKFTDALWIVVLGIVIGAVVGLFNLGWIIAAIIMLIVWLLLIKHFFDCGWLKALAIAIIAVVIFIIIIAVLAIIGFGILTWLF